MKWARIIGQTAAGIAGGLAASFVMSKFQSGWKTLAREFDPDSAERQAKEGESATVKAANRVSQKSTGEPVPEPHKETAGEAVHYGFGALLGGLYGAAGAVAPQVRAGFGTLFGTAVWAVADEIAVPAADLSKPPQQVPPSQHLYAIASHLLFGAVVEGSRRAIEGSADAIGRKAERQFA